VEEISTSFISVFSNTNIYFLAIRLVISVGRRRGEVEILMDVLSLCLSGVRVTHLMYRANLSYSTLRKYLSEALDRGLISNVCNSDGSVVYRTTEKGKLLLYKLKEVKSALRC
jgi:predicted transcriptional regulator